MPRATQAYPWNLLERIPKSTVTLARRVRPLIEHAVSLSNVASEVASTLGCECQLVGERLTTGRSPASPEGLTLCFDFAGVTAALWFDGDLAAVAVARVLGRVPPLAPPGARADSTIAGALAAIIVEVARRAGTRPISVRREPPPDADGVQLELTALIDERPYRIRAWACPMDLPTSESTRRSLTELGGLPISLPLVASTCTAAREDFAALSPGDVWVPGAWTAKPTVEAGAEPSFRGQLALAAPSSERGLWVDCSPDARLVLTARVAALEIDATDEHMENVNDTLADAVLDAPIVVRIEVGAVTLSARQWSELRPGDVIETGQRLGAPAVLRVAGREVAHGELVSVDGELGVRIRNILDAGEAR